MQALVMTLSMKQSEKKRVRTSSALRLKLMLQLTGSHKYIITNSYSAAVNQEP